MTFPLSVPLARSRPVDDRTLAVLRRVAHDVPVSMATEAEAETDSASEEEKSES